MTAAALILLAVLTMTSAPLWTDGVESLRSRRGSAVLIMVWVALLTLAAWLAFTPLTHTRGARELAVALAVLASLAGGGPLARAVLRLADHGPSAAPTGPARIDVLTGGAWIGALERIAVTATLLAGWPEGLALVLAVKGLGRYPELHSAASADLPGATERFIVGTFASSLWAAGCAGVGLAFLR